MKFPDPPVRYIQHPRANRRTRPGSSLQGPPACRPGGRRRQPTEGGHVMAWIRRNLLVLAAAAVLGGAAGCGFHPAAFLLVPTPPWVAERMEEKYQHKNDHRTPILPPIRD